MATAVSFMLVLFVALVKGLPCGYNDNCTCTGRTMDCSDLGLKNISQICENIGNYTNLKASGNYIRRIDKGDLVGCDNVQMIELNNNSLHTVHNFAFAELKDLHYIDLSYDSLQEVYSDKVVPLFQTLSQLVTLRLNHNLQECHITKSYPDIATLFSLTELYLDGIEDTSFPVLFQNLTRLTNLSLSGFDGICTLGHLRQNTFENLPMLKFLNISKCNIKNIDEDTFKPLQHLEYLDLSYNQHLGLVVLANVSYGLQFTNIQFLNYSKMLNTFGTSTKLLKRDLCFLRNTTLKTLALDSNRIAIVETNAIALLPITLEVIHINDNILNFSPYLLQTACVPSLKEFYASAQTKRHRVQLYNREDYAVADLVYNSKKTCPYMNDTVLKNISKSIKLCQFLEDSEKLTFSGISFPENLKKIEITHSAISYNIPHMVFSRMHNHLRHIDFSSNLLYSFDGPVGVLENVEYIDLSNNFCCNIENNFFYYTGNLKTLILKENNIGKVLSQANKSHIFRGLNKLTTLDLSSNSIATINPAIFAGLKELTALNLSNNAIQHLDIQYLQRLSDLNLASNAIQYLQDSIIKHFENLVTFSIDLQNNRIDCSCKRKVFISWLVDNNLHFVGYENYIFEDEAGNEITRKNCEHFVANIDKACSSYTLLIVLTSVGLSTFFSILTGGVIYKNRWKIRYFLYMSKSHFYGYRRLPDEDVIENYKYDAFISYAEEDIPFILDGIIPNLEEAGMSVCIHQRDFIAGRPITDNIIEAIKSSRRTVIILSTRFVRRKWCLYEFNMARMESIYSRSRQSALLIVMLENVPMRKMPREMLDWLNKEAYLEYSEEPAGRALFWDRLSQAIRQ